jgi:hypothetical protein
MKKTISQLLKEVDSVYLVATKNGDTVIRVSGHLPDPDRLRCGNVTADCKNIYLILVKSLIDPTQEDDVKLAELIEQTESSDENEKRRGETSLNNAIVWLGEDAGNKRMDYMIIDGKSDDEINATVNVVKRMLKTSVFNPLRYI